MSLPCFPADVFPILKHIAALEGWGSLCPIITTFCMESQLLETSPAPSALDLGGAAGAPEHPTMQTLESAPVAPSEAIIEGRVLYRRDLGGIMFVRLEGPWGSVQVVCDRTTLSEGAWAQCPLLVPGSLARFTICSTALSFPWTKDPDVPDASTEALQVKPTVDSLPAPASDLIRETTAERETRSSRIAKADPHRVPEVDPELGHRDCNSNCSRSSDTIPDLSVHSGEHQSAAGASNVRPAAGGPGPQVGGPAADCRRPSTGGATPPEPPPTAATATQSSATAAHPPSLTALTVDLMECHAHPAAVARVLKALEAGTLSPATAVAVLHCSPEELERLRSLSGAPAHDKATAFAYKQLAVTISRRLAGNPKQKRRRPHIRYAYRQLLAKLAAVQAHWALHPLPAPDDCEADAPLDPVHNLVDSSNAARVHYCEARKRPQIAWVLGRVAGMVPPSGRGCTLVDVGCGRGDLAVNAAVRFPEAQVRVPGGQGGWSRVNKYWYVTDGY